MSDFIEVARVDEIPEGEMKSFVVDGKQVLIVNYSGNYYAIGAKCTHMGGDLSKGKLERETVTCPRHGSKFDITTGASVAGPKIGFLKLKTKDEAKYEVKVEGRSIKVSKTPVQG